MITNEEIKQRLDEGSAHFAAIDESLAAIKKMLEPLPQMKRDIAKSKRDGEAVKELVETWSAIKTGGKFVKWVAPLVGAVGGAWVFVKTGIARIFP